MQESVPNYYEFRVQELQKELDQMHALVNEEHGHDSVLANYVEQIKEKDLLIKERDEKLQELANQNGLLESEK